MSSSYSANSSVTWTRLKPHLWPVGSVVLGTFMLSLILTGSWPRAHEAESVLRLRASDPGVGKLDPDLVAAVMREDGNLLDAAADSGVSSDADSMRSVLSLTAEVDPTGDVLVRTKFMADDPAVAAAFVGRLGERYGEGLRKAAIDRLRLKLVAAREAATAALDEKRKAELTLQSFLEERAAARVAQAPLAGDASTRPTGAAHVQLVSNQVPAHAQTGVHQASHATYYAPASGAPSRVTLLGDASLAGRGGVTLVEAPAIQDSLSRRQLEAEYGELARRKRQITEQHPHYGEIVARLVQLERMLAEQPGGIQPMPGPPIPGPAVPRPNDIYATPLPASQRPLPTRGGGQPEPLPRAQGPGLVAPTQSLDSPAIAWTAENLEAYRHQVEEIKRLDEVYQQNLLAEQEAWQRQQAAETAQVFSVSPVGTRMELHPQRRNTWLMFAMLMAGVMGAACAYLRRRALAVFVTPRDAADFLPVPVLGTLPGAAASAMSMPRMARLATGWMKPAGEISILGMVVWMLGMGILDSGYLHDLADDPLRGVAMCLAKTFGVAA